MLTRTPTDIFTLISGQIRVNEVAATSFGRLTTLIPVHFQLRRPIVLRTPHHVITKKQPPCRVVGDCYSRSAAVLPVCLLHWSAPAVVGHDDFFSPHFWIWFKITSEKYFCSNKSLMMSYPALLGRMVIVCHCRFNTAYIMRRGEGRVGGRTAAAWTPASALISSSSFYLWSP